jgi:PAS domain S-box-containing protein
VTANKNKTKAQLLSEISALRAQLECLSAGLLTQLLDHAPCPIYVRSREGKYLLVNRTLEKLFGKPAVDIIGRTLGELTSPELAAPFDDRNQEIFETGKFFSYHETIPSKDGTKYYHLVKFPLLDADGNIQAVAGISIDNTAVREAEIAAQHYAEKLQTLSHRLMEAQEMERRNLARELHDEIGQILTAIILNLRLARGLNPPGAVATLLDESMEIAEGAIQQVRSLSLELRPAMLDHLGLPATLRWFLDRQAQRGGFRVTFTDKISSNIDITLATTCFRIAQEALTNVVRHACATEVTVDLQQSGNTLQLTIEDDGVGFDAAAAQKQVPAGTALGLLGMQERVQIQGGSISIESSPDNGTRVQVRFPIEPDEEPAPE